MFKVLQNLLGKTTGKSTTVTSAPPVENMLQNMMTTIKDVDKLDDIEFAVGDAVTLILPKDREFTEEVMAIVGIELTVTKVLDDGALTVKLPNGEIFDYVPKQYLRKIEECDIDIDI